MILIADSGATKCHWALTDGSSVEIVETHGINPVTSTAEQVAEIIRDRLLPQMPQCQIEHIYFYGAGCIDGASATEQLRNTLSDFFKGAEVEVAGDMLGAARALCGHDAGIACILGTGSNSAMYDGCKLTMNVPPLGYILGDEGGGAYMGRMLLGDALKGLMPHATVEMLYAECGTSYAQIIENVYRRPNANRYLASFVHFMVRHRTLPEIGTCIDRAFEAFILRNLLQYPDVKSMKIHFAGGIASALSTELKAALDRHSLNIGQIAGSPISGMVKYHTTQL